MKWRPIKTAPKDGTLILLAEYVGYVDPPAWNVMMGRWVGDHHREWDRGPGQAEIDDEATNRWVVCYAALYPGCDHVDTWHPKTLYFSPTHWMPLPKPPVKHPH